MNKKESNVFIVRFMGLEIVDRPYDNGFVVLSNTEICNVDDLLYHSDWNLIMSVVKKIDSIILDQPVVSPLEELADDVFNSLREVNLELTHELIVRFINQYNVMALGSVRHIRLYNEETHLSLEGSQLDTIDESETDAYLTWYGRKTVNNQIN